jgi:hypothetical protein
MQVSEITECLGIFWQPVLSLLHRTPSLRPSIKDFCIACHSLVNPPAPRTLCVMSEDMTGSSLVRLDCDSEQTNSFHAQGLQHYVKQGFLLQTLSHP